MGVQEEIRAEIWMRAIEVLKFPMADSDTLKTFAIQFADGILDAYTTRFCELLPTEAATAIGPMTVKPSPENIPLELIPCMHCGKPSSIIKMVEVSRTPTPEEPGESLVRKTVEKFYYCAECFPGM